MQIAMGVYDAPQIQKQPVFNIDPFRSNIAVFGGPMSGKTTFIKTYLVRMNENPRYACRENIYIIDFGGNMGEYARLGNVCACFDNSNEENIKRIFKVVEQRLTENAKALGSNNFYALYQTNPRQCPIHMTLIIENLNAFLSDERYTAYQDLLLKLCRDGLSKGLTVITTANDLSGTHRLMANFGQKVAFEMSGDNYFEIFGTKVNMPMKLPGRGIVNIDSVTYEFQCFLPFPDEKKDLPLLLRNSRQEDNPAYLSSFDEELTKDNIGHFCTDISGKMGPDRTLVGLDYYEHKPVILNTDESRSIAIYGKRKFGKTNLLRLLLAAILPQHEGARLILLDDGRKQLKEFENYAADVQYLTSVESFRDYLTENGYGGERSIRTAKKAPGPNPRPMPGTDPKSLPGMGPKPVAGMGLKPMPGMGPKPLPEMGHGSIPGMQQKPVVSEISDDTPYTVFVLQSKSLYQSSVDAEYLMKKWIPEMIGNAEARQYLFIFSDVRTISSPEVRLPFNNNISVAFLLDNISEFIVDKGNKSVFGEMDAKELKTEYAKCSVGDGYCYDVEADILTKLKFIKN